MAKKHVFVSYARKDERFADTLISHLRQSHLTAWQDVRGLRGGDDWQRKIDDALRCARAVILILTPHSVSSPYVTYEWAFACGRGVRVIPVLRTELESVEDLHPRLRPIQWIDLTSPRPRPDDWLRLLEAIPSR